MERRVRRPGHTEPSGTGQPPASRINHFFHGERWPLLQGFKRILGPRRCHLRGVRRPGPLREASGREVAQHPSGGSNPSISHERDRQHQALGDKETSHHLQTTEVYSEKQETNHRRSQQNALRGVNRLSLVGRRRVTIRGQQVTEQDWRGILAVLTTLGYFLAIALALVRYEFEQVLIATGVLSTPETLVLSWYFKAKEDGK